MSVALAVLITVSYLAEAYACPFRKANVKLRQGHVDMHESQLWAYPLRPELQIFSGADRSLGINYLISHRLAILW
jgi:hypothetical protein